MEDQKKTQRKSQSKYYAFVKVAVHSDVEPSREVTQVLVADKQKGLREQLRNPDIKEVLSVVHGRKYAVAERREVSFSKEEINP